MYDEVQYWNARAEPNYVKYCPDFVTRAHIEYVKKNLSDCSNILDFGPGIGRIFPAYQNVKTVQGYDVSSLYKERVCAASMNFDFVFDLVVAPAIQQLPFEDNQFDAAVSVSVFLHQRPSNILLVMRELVRVAKKVIAVTWQEPKVPFHKIGDNTLIRPEEYCFHYPYLSICYDNGWVVQNSEQFDRYLMFTYSKEK
jgi:ubiquinone/menaquinone biosynthesis C-methylase UbiE